MIKPTNQSVLDFLAYYSDVERKLDYAVMLNGPWGSGKTYLVKKFLADHEQRDGKHLYVSLYGITSTRQVEEEFYRLLHPILSSKGMRMAGVLMRGAAKGLLKIDLGTGHNATETISFSPPAIDLADFLSGPGGRLLVFDDLERCKMPISDVLGYINAFVEHDGMKVIILGNEAEIIGRETNYLSIKEKLIGQTLRVSADVFAAYPSFLADISTTRVRDLMQQKGELVLTVHRESDTNNLRILKQAMWDFERLAAHIPDKDWSNSDALHLLLQQTLAMSVEIRAGRLSQEELPLFANDGLVRYIRQKKESEPKADELFEKRYSGILLSDPAVRVDLLGKILIEGLNEAEIIQSALRESRHFAEASDLPAWRRVWYGFESDDADYETALAILEAEFAERRENEPAIVYHIFGVRLQAAQIGALPFSKEDVLAQGKAYVDDLATSGRLLTAIDRQLQIGGSRGFDGLGYTNVATSEFRDFISYYTEVAGKVEVASYPERAKTVIAKLDVEPGEFRRDLCHNDFRPSPYASIPLLAAIPADEFVKKLFSVSPQAQIEVFRTLKSRYDFCTLTQDLAPEQPWLAEVRKKIANELTIARPMTRYRINALMADDLDPLFADDKEQESSATNK